MILQQLKLDEKNAPGVSLGSFKLQASVTAVDLEGNTHYLSPQGRKIWGGGGPMVFRGKGKGGQSSLTEYKGGGAIESRLPMRGEH